MVKAWGGPHILLSALLLLGGGAVAGTEQAPELTDASGDASPAPANQYADITAGWVNESEEMLTLFLQLSAFPGEPVEGQLYALGFQTIDQVGTCYGMYAWMFFQEGSPVFEAGPVNACASQPDESISISGTAPTAESPRIALEMPKVLLNQSTRGTDLLNFSAVSFNFYPFLSYAAGEAVGDAVAGSAGIQDVANAPASSYTLQMGEEPPFGDEGETGSANGTGTAGNTPGNGTGPSGGPGMDAGPEDENGSPALAVLASLTTVAVLALSLRRS